MNKVSASLFIFLVLSASSFAQEALLDFASMEGPSQVNITWGENTTIRMYVYDTDGTQATPDEGTNVSVRAVDARTRQEVIPALSFVNDRYEIYYFGRNPGEYLIYANISKGDRQRNAGPVYVTVYQDRGNLSYMYISSYVWGPLNPGNTTTLSIRAYDLDGTSATEWEGTTVGSEVFFRGRDGSSRSLGALSFRASGDGRWAATFSPQEVGNYTISAYATKAGITANDSEAVIVIPQNEGGVLDYISASPYRTTISVNGNSTISVYAQDVDGSYATPAEGTSIEGSVSLTQNGNTRDLGAIRFQNPRNTSYTYFFQPSETGTYTFSIIVRKNGIERTDRSIVEAIPAEQAQSLDRVSISTYTAYSMRTGVSQRVTIYASDADGSYATPDEGTSVSGSVAYSYNGRTQDLGALQFNYTQYGEYTAYFTPTEEGNYTFRGVATKAGITRNSSRTLRAVNDDMANVLDRASVYSSQYQVRSSERATIYANAYDYDGSPATAQEGTSFEGFVSKDGSRVATLSFQGRYDFTAYFTPSSPGDYNITATASKNGVYKTASYRMRVVSSSYGNNLGNIYLYPSSYSVRPGSQVGVTVYAYDDDYSYSTPQEGTQVEAEVTESCSSQGCTGSRLFERLEFSYSSGVYSSSFTPARDATYTIVATARRSGSEKSASTTVTASQNPGYGRYTPRLSTAEISSQRASINAGSSYLMYLYAMDEDGTPSTPNEGTQIGTYLSFQNETQAQSGEPAYLSDFQYDSSKSRYASTLYTSSVPGTYVIRATARKAGASIESNTLLLTAYQGSAYTTTTTTASASGGGSSGRGQSKLYSAELKSEKESAPAGESIPIYFYAMDEDGTPSTPQEGTSVGGEITSICDSPGCIGATKVGNVAFEYSQEGYYKSAFNQTRPGAYSISAAAKKNEWQESSTIRLIVQKPEPPKPPAPIKVSLSAGWNLISTPLSSLVLLDGVLSSGGCKAKSPLWHYNGKEYESSQSLSPGWGYWLYMKDSCEAEFKGGQLSKYPLLTLRKGWNQMGALSKPVEFKDIAGTCSRNSTIFQYNSKENKYISTTTLTPGYGYWIYAREACTLGIILPVFPSPKNESSANWSWTASAPSLGPKDAKVTVVEFTDFNCPYCSIVAGKDIGSPQYDRMLGTDKKLMEEYVQTGKVRFINNVIGSWNVMSDSNPVNAVYCARDIAGDTGFFLMRDTLFSDYTRVKDGRYSSGELKQIARKVGFNPDKFNSCMDSRKYLNQSRKNYDDALNSGVWGAPIFAVNQKVLENGSTYTVLKAAIDEALSEN